MVDCIDFFLLLFIFIEHIMDYACKPIARKCIFATKFADASTWCQRSVFSLFVSCFTLLNYCSLPLVRFVILSVSSWMTNNWYDDNLAYSRCARYSFMYCSTRTADAVLSSNIMCVFHVSFDGINIDSRYIAHPKWMIFKTIAATAAAASVAAITNTTTKTQPRFIICH